MSEVLPELLVIVAALVGGLISWAATWQVQRSRDKWASRDHDRDVSIAANLRLETRRIDVYVDFLSAANSLYSLVRHPTSVELPDKYRKRIYEGMASLDAKMSATFLVSTDQTVRDSIGQVIKTSRALTLAVTTDSADDLASLLAQQRKAVTIAESLMRQAIGYTEESL